MVKIGPVVFAKSEKTCFFKVHLTKVGNFPLTRAILNRSSAAVSMVLVRLASLQPKKSYGRPKIFT
jgi:hypothetical protein